MKGAISNIGRIVCQAINYYLLVAEEIFSKLGRGIVKNSDNASFSFLEQINALFPLYGIE